MEKTIAAPIRQVNNEDSEFHCRIVCGCRCSAMCANTSHKSISHLFFVAFSFDVIYFAFVRALVGWRWCHSAQHSWRQSYGMYARARENVCQSFRKSFSLLISRRLWKNKRWVAQVSFDYRFPCYFWIVFLSFMIFKLWVEWLSQDYAVTMHWDMFASFIVSDSRNSNSIWSATNRQQSHSTSI